MRFDLSTVCSGIVDCTVYLYYF